ncbi:hypothetical protein, partial [Bacteroides uniformis]|uniref:hypothetical protein n=1 Tax=Bacteroides uniformis TaxID=820 RepID=UPI001AA0DE08
VLRARGEKRQLIYRDNLALMGELNESKDSRRHAEHGMGPAAAKKYIVVEFRVNHFHFHVDSFSL